MPTSHMTANQYRALLDKQEAGGMNKHHAVRTFYDGIWFDSIAESQRYAELKLMQRGGLIAGLDVHPVYQLEDCKYIPDFRYTENGVTVVEDVKSPSTKTPVWRLKWKGAKRIYTEVDWRVYP